MKLKKNMRLGNKLILILIFSLLSYNILIAEEKITTTPLINVEKIIPSFEEIESENENISTNQNLKEKNVTTDLKSSQAILIGLDKITAKSSELIVNLNEIKKFGPLEIKILKCGKVKVNNVTDSVAYMQVKDLTKMKMSKYLYLTVGLLLQIQVLLLLIMQFMIYNCLTAIMSNKIFLFQAN